MLLTIFVLCLRQDHILDANAFVRAKCLNLMAECIRRALIRNRNFTSLAQKVANRICDKTPTVRKAACQAIVAIIESRAARFKVCECGSKMSDRSI